MADDLTDLAQRLTALATGLGGKALEDVMTKLGVAAKKDAVAAANRDLGGDARFSGWKKAGALSAGFEHVGVGVIEVKVRPIGPWKVAEFGRSAGMSRGRKGGRRRKGVVQTAVAPRKVSASRGKGTWTDATTETVAQTPERALNLLYEMARGIVGA